MKVAAIQHDIAWEDARTTTKQLAGARLVVLSEMFATGFSMAPERIAEPEDGPTEQWLAEQAAMHRCWLLGSIAQYPRARETSDRPPVNGQPTHQEPTSDQPAKEMPVNVAVLAGPNGERHRYEKIHPFSYGDEHHHYRAGDSTLTVAIDGVRVSVLICYDLRFADVFWALADRTDLYVVVANWPAVRHEPWRSLLQARAIENLAYVVGVNRVGSAPAKGRDGRDRDVPHAGGSVVVDPVGTRLVEARDVETTLLADIDPDHVRRTRERFGFLADRTDAWTLR